MQDVYGALEADIVLMRCCVDLQSLARQSGPLSRTGKGHRAEFESLTPGHVLPILHHGCAERDEDRLRTMNGELNGGRQDLRESEDIGRRKFVAGSVTAGLAASAGLTSAADAGVVESDVEIRTPA